MNRFQLASFEAPQILLGLVTLMLLLLKGHHQIFNLLQTLGSLALSGLQWISGLGPSSGSLDRKYRRWIEVAGQRLSDRARTTHTHIVGATGSGKTVLMEQLILADIARGSGALIIDAKGDRSFYDRLRKECCALGRGLDLYLLSATHPQESVVWNPCGFGGVSELQSKFHLAAIYSEEHYEKACESGYLKAFQMLHEAKPEGFTLRDLAAAIEQVSHTMDKGILEGIYLDLSNTIESEWGEVLGLRGAADAAREVSLLDIVTENKILYVDLPTESKLVQSSRVGRLLLQELMAISGLRKSYPELAKGLPFSVYIDEFDVFATPRFSVFLNKGRSSNFAIHLAHQTLGDLNKISPDFKDQIIGNTNVRFIFRQDIPDDAEYWSRLLGTRAEIKKTWSTSNGVATGDSSNREVREFNVAPDEIKSFKVGQCIFSIKESGIIRKLKIPYSPKTKVPLRQAIKDQYTRRLSNLSPATPGLLAASHALSGPNLIAGFGVTPTMSSKRTLKAKSTAKGETQ